MRTLHARVGASVSTRRPMHLTVHTGDDVPSLRTDAAMGVFRELLAGARLRGMRTVALTIMPTHVHWVVVAESAEALRDATRFVFGQFARRFDALVGRRGKVFVGAMTGHPRFRVRGQIRSGVSPEPPSRVASVRRTVR